jgi:HK97 family phage portal protein
MALFDFMRRKEVSTEQLGDFYATSIRAPQVSPLGRRPSMTDLAARYGMLVHRCVAINATTAASIQPRLFAIGNAATLTKARGLHPKPLDAQTKDFMRGRMSVAPSASVVRKIKGNLENIVELESHPVLDLFDDVNEQQEGIGFREGFYSDLQLFGRNFTLLVRDGSRQPTSMWRLLPQVMKVVPGKEKFLSHYEYGSGVEKVRYEPEDVFWVHVYDPSDPYGGVGPLEAWLQTVDAQFGNAAFVENMYRRGGAPDYVLMAKGGMSEAQKRSFRSEFRRLFGRMVNRQDTIAILSGEAELKPLQRAPRELQTVEQEQYTIEALAIAFGVPKSLLTTDDVNLANAREGSITHARNTILPMLRRFEDAVNQRLLPLWSDRLFLMHDNPVREDREIRIKERPSQLAAGYTVNEIRLADDLEPLDMPAADTPMIAANLIPLGAPQVEQQEVEEAVENRAAGDESFTKMLFGEHCCEHHEIDKQAGIPEEEWPRAFEDGAHKILSKMIGDVLRAVSVADKSLGATTKASVDYAAFSQAIDMGYAEDHIYDLGIQYLTDIMDGEGKAVAATLQSQFADVGVEIAFDIDNKDAKRWIERNSVAMAKDIPKKAQKDIRQRIARHVSIGSSIGEIARELEGMRRNRPGSWSRERAKLIARTETMMATNYGKVEAWKQSSVVKGKKFALAPGACLLCQQVKSDQPNMLDLAEEFFAKGSSIEYGERADGSPRIYNFDYMGMGAPPVHPNCRCGIEAVTFTNTEIVERLE